MEPERPVVISTAADGHYLLTGLVVCGVCGRRADGTHWVHDRPGYRCRHGCTSASSAAPGRPKAVYWREDELLTRAGHQLAHDVPASTDHRVTAAYLRARKLRIVSGHNTVTIRSHYTGPTPTAHTQRTPAGGENRLCGVNVSDRVSLCLHDCSAPSAGVAMIRAAGGYSPPARPWPPRRGSTDAGSRALHGTDSAGGCLDHLTVR
jgi:hypothetical protein